MKLILAATSTTISVGYLTLYFQICTLLHRPNGLDVLRLDRSLLNGANERVRLADKVG